MRDLPFSMKRVLAWLWLALVFAYGLASIGFLVFVFGRIIATNPAHAAIEVVSFILLFLTVSLAIGAAIRLTHTAIDIVKINRNQGGR